MADMNDDLDDGKMDSEAHHQRQEQTKEIEALGFDQEQYEAIESEFKEFLSDHLKNKDLDKFKQEYQKINKALKTSYDGEKKLIKKCKELISSIFEKASNYRAALRMANNEVEKIASLKQEVSKSYEEVQKHREEEEKYRETIGKIKVDINNLKRKQQQTSELEEDIKLRQLMAEFEDLRKEKEEKEERLDNMKSKNRDLMDKKEQIINDNLKIADEILAKDKMIDQIKDSAKQMERQKKDLDDETTDLRKNIEAQKVIVDEKKKEYLDVREANKEAKIKIIDKETAIQSYKTHISH